MKNKTRNKKSLIALLILLLFCAAYVAYDIADWGTPVISALVPTGGFVLICIYLVLRQIGLKRKVCYAILTGIFAVTLFYIRTYAKETTTNDSQWIPITHLDFMCKDSGDGYIQLCSITCKESCSEVYAGVFKLPDGKVKVYFCREKPEAPAERLTSCELNTGRSVFRVVVRADKEFAALQSVTLGDGIRDAFTDSFEHSQQLTPVFVQPAINPQQALQIAARELQTCPDSLAVYAKDFCYSVEPRLPEDSLGGGETLDIDMNTGNILRRYFTE